MPERQHTVYTEYNTVDKVQYRKNHSVERILFDRLNEWDALC